MRKKDYAIRDCILNELRCAYPNWLTCAELGKQLGLPSNKIYYYVEDMFFSQGHPPIISRISYLKPRHNEYKAIKRID